MHVLGLVVGSVKEAKGHCRGVWLMGEMAPSPTTHWTDPAWGSSWDTNSSKPHNNARLKNWELQTWSRWASQAGRAAAVFIPSGEGMGVSGPPRAWSLSLGTGPGWWSFTRPHSCGQEAGIPQHLGSPGVPLALLWGITRWCLCPL